MFNRKIAAIVAGTTISLGALSGVALAQTPTTATTGAQATKPARLTDAEHQAMHDQRQAELAARLGVTKEKLDQAMKDQRKADIDKAVAAGRLTAAQATELKAAIDRGEHIGRGGLGFGGHGGRGPGGPGRQATASATSAA